MKRLYFMLLYHYCASSLEPDLKSQPIGTRIGSSSRATWGEFSNKTRNYYTPINDPSLFEQSFLELRKRAGIFCGFIFIPTFILQRMQMNYFRWMDQNFLYRNLMTMWSISPGRSSRSLEECHGVAQS